MKTLFDHEKLDVYREALLLCGRVGEFLAGGDHPFEQEQAGK